MAKLVVSGAMAEECDIKKGKENKILFYFRTQFEHNFITKSFQQIRLAMVDTGQVKINLDLPRL